MKILNASVRVYLIPFFIFMIGIFSVVYSISLSYGFPAFEKLGLIFVGAILICMSFGYLVHSVVANLKEELENIKSDLSQEIKLYGKESSDVEKTFKSQSDFLTNYKQILKDTKQNVCILGTNLLPFFWNTDFEEITLSALSRGISFRILILDPRSKYFHSFSKSENLNKNELKASIQRWKELGIKNQSNNSIQIRLYSECPTLALFLTENTAIYSPYLRSKSVTSTPHIKINKPSTLSTALRDHFEKIWDESRPYENSIELQ